MGSELLPLADASALLGVSVERVRKLVVGGQLPGVRFGNVWVVPRDAVVARRQRSVHGGRPLQPLRAWKEIVSGQVDLIHADQFQRRAVVRRCEMSRADIEVVHSRLGALVGGALAAVEYEELLPADDAHVDLYLSRAASAELSSIVALVDNPLGAVALRVVDDASWAVLHQSSAEIAGVAPRGAVILDLLESGDPRHWVAAEHLAGVG